MSMLIPGYIYADNHELLDTISFLTLIHHLNFANRPIVWLINPALAKSECVVDRTHRETGQWA